MLRGQAAAVRRTTIYNWLNGSSLPMSVESLLAVVHACADHARIRVSPVALRSDREWAALLAQAKQERDSRSGQARQRRPGEPGPSEPGPPLPPSWEALHPAEAGDRLARLDKRDPDRAVAEMYAMKPHLACAILEHMDHERSLGLLARVQPAWVAECAADWEWFRDQLHQMPADRGIEVFELLTRRSARAAARTLSAMEPDQALRFLNAIDESRLNMVLEQMSRDNIDRLLDRMTPDRAAAALVAHADWAAYMLMIHMDRRRADAIISRIGSGRLSAVLGAAKTDYVARLIRKMDRATAADWLDRMEAAYAAGVLQSIGPERIVALLRDLDRSQAAWWLGRMEAADAARVLELLEPDDEAALIGSLEPGHAARYLGLMPAAGAGRMLAVSARLHGLPRAAEILGQMDPKAAYPALASMDPDQFAPLLKQAGPGFVDVMLTAQARSKTGVKTAQIIHAVCASPADLAGLLTRNPPAVAARVAEALPIPEAADALASMDLDQAHQVLKLVPRIGSHTVTRSLPYPKSAFERYGGQQIEILKAIEQRDEATAKRLTGLLGLAPPEPPRWEFASPEDLDSGNTGPHAGYLGAEHRLTVVRPHVTARLQLDCRRSRYSPGVLIK
jgi:Mg/Co/Ni transporter MgtE